MASQDWFEKDFYAVLGTSKDASDAELKKVYRKLARQYHPDSNPGDPKAEARFKEVSEAYTVLSDPEQRAEYDQMRAMGAGGARFTAGGPQGGGYFVEGVVEGAGFGGLQGVGGAGAAAPLGAVDVLDGDDPALDGAVRVQEPVEGHLEREVQTGREEGRGLGEPGAVRGAEGGVHEAVAAAGEGVLPVGDPAARGGLGRTGGSLAGERAQGVGEGTAVDSLQHREGWRGGDEGAGGAQPLDDDVVGVGEFVEPG